MQNTVPITQAGREERLHAFMPQYPAAIMETNDNSGDPHATMTFRQGPATLCFSFDVKELNADPDVAKLKVIFWQYSRRA